MQLFGLGEAREGKGQKVNEENSAQPKRLVAASTRNIYVFKSRTDIVVYTLFAFSKGRLIRISLFTTSDSALFSSHSSLSFSIC